MNARVALLKVEPISTEGNVKDPINLDITFEAYEDMPEEIEFEMVVAWDGDHTNDQILDSIEVGPVKKGKHQFIFDAAKVIDFSKVKNEYTTDVCVLFLHCAYRNQRFASVSFYISHQYTDEEMLQNPPEKVDLDKIKRLISVDDFRVTTFPIKWTETDDLMPPPEETVDEELQNGDSQFVEPPIAI